VGQPSSRIENLNLTACRLTEECKTSLLDFLGEFSRKLSLDLRLQTQSMKKGSSLALFREELTSINKHVLLKLK
jgi:hypothetical protein